MLCGSGTAALLSAPGEVALTVCPGADSLLPGASDAGAVAAGSETSAGGAAAVSLVVAVVVVVTTGSDSSVVIGAGLSDGGVTGEGSGRGSAALSPMDVGKNGALMVGPPRSALTTSAR